MNRLRRAVAAVALVVVVTLTPGCMTLIDAFSSQPNRLGIYGGTRTYLLGDTAAGSSNMAMLVFFFFLVDFPLSLAFDTLFLPITIPYTLSREPTESEKIEQVSEAAAERKDAAAEREKDREDLPEVDRLLGTISDAATGNDQRAAAVARLGVVGRDDPRVVPCLVGLLPVARGAVQLAALESLDALGEFGRVDETLEELLRTLPRRSQNMTHKQKMAWRSARKRTELRWETPLAPIEPRFARLLGGHPDLCVRVARNQRHRRPGRCAAIEGMATLQEPSPVVVSTLRALREDRAVAFNASAALFAFATSPHAQEALAEQASKGESVDRCQAIRELGQAERPTASGEAALLAGAADPDPTIREAALRSLTHVPAAKAVPLLAKALREPALRGLALDALTARGPKAEAAAAQLASLLSVPEVAVRACRALTAIGPGASGAVLGLVAASQSSDPELVKEALQTLSAIGDRAAASGLITALERGQPPEAILPALKGLVLYHEEERLTKLFLDESRPDDVRSAAISVVRQNELRAFKVMEALRHLAFGHPDGREHRLAKEASAAYDYLRRGF